MIAVHSSYRLFPNNNYQSFLIPAAKQVFGGWLGSHRLTRHDVHHLQKRNFYAQTWRLKEWQWRLSTCSCTLLLARLIFMY
eukprot:scaffold1354_cov17-Tisochrysis_lutea.AAC.2